MKKILTILFTVTILTAFGQKGESVKLKWKIAKNEKITYATVMNDIDTATMEMDFGGLFNALADSSGKGLKDGKDFFNKINQAYKNQDYVTTLTNKGNGVIDIVMATKPKAEAKETETDTTYNPEKEALKMMKSMAQGVMLRGSVYDTGGIQSFWLKSSQKNLIALFFELPTKPVKVGDKWPLDINLIANDQNFVCDTAYKLNEVTLTDIKKVNGETIAVLKYNIVEYVKGDFNSSSFFSKDSDPKKTMMKFVHQGIAEFSVDRGRWVSYDGIMSMHTTGIMTSNKKTKFTLIDEQGAGK